MTFKDNGYRLTSGREFYAYGDMLSIDPEGSLCFGSDGDVEEAKRNLDDGFHWVYDAGHWTPEERAEVADFMIARWLKFKDGK